jgi:hypothetical protein
VRGELGVLFYRRMSGGGSGGLRCEVKGGKERGPGRSRSVRVTGRRDIGSVAASGHATRGVA